ncbi:flagellar biosynthesis protein FlhA [Parazoarcus communis]|uniref:Flagellar biosynthesis protein FlhA n=1 Tax=Parazoarcus communis SWub3 = DSM 12120 TaxID=1121029 RepID=A0A323UZ08_9RHOO|nr:flagellar biosynthesis protein FlhA [Parazoarcus communis]NMG69052.1 flagellar type III secretion system protein FlhA [Parazoarcus communis SWub3 = DSM 12120]PZA16910.1 flagellar biosynthesis protein FlhA [Azoarcus communis] [Parazoarcus communis SWub3 = DSM 12120]
MKALKPLLPILTSGQIGIPVIILSILAMIILPLPPLVLDMLFTFNISVAILVLMVSVSAKRPLDFSLFPTIILITTLMRLTLNVASTRVVLLEGHTGSAAAGKVIEAFGEVVIGGNFIVGLIVFVILMVINFMVVTKGGERISEVTARFTLDALPGKQMAIDADLNAGLISQEEAKQRRKDVGKEADFYGAMDGAAKFVRGDAVAGILILLINLIGGFAIGLFIHDLGAGDAFRQYALLTIGDGLVAQIPALLLSTAAAIIVTRINESAAMPSQIRQQLLVSPSLIYTVAGILFVLAIVPGMPHLAFLGFSALIAMIGWAVSRFQPVTDNESHENASAIAKAMDAEHAQKLDWQDIPLVDSISISLGYKLVGLVSPEAGAPLPQRVRGVRQTLSETFGFLLPEVQIRDSLRLKPQQYQLFINGEKVEDTEIHPEHLMAIPSPNLYGEIDGIIGIDPAYAMPVVWIRPEDKTHALNLGYQVIDPSGVIATHLNKIVREHLPELFTHDDVEQLLQRLSVQSPKLTESLRAQLSHTVQHRVYRMLLQEQVSLKDINTIATALVESSEISKDPILLASDVRFALRRSILSSVAGDRKDLSIFVLDNTLENTLMGALTAAQQAGQVSLDSIPVDPSLLGQLQSSMPVVKEKLRAAGQPPILVVLPQLRPLLARYARVFSPGLHVLSQNEIPDRVSVSLYGTLG